MELPPKNRNHFRALDGAAKGISDVLRHFRKRMPGLYLIVNIIVFILVAIFTWRIEQACEEGSTMTLLLAMAGILVFLAIFVFDYLNARRINHQFFWKPWILIGVLVGCCGLFGFRISDQKAKSASALSETNAFYFSELNKKDAKISDAGAALEGIKKTFSEELGKRTEKFDELKGELSATKQERDKYQIMLAPFEAYAIAKYTNAPIDDRLVLLGATMSLITNELANDRPVIHLEINGQKIKGYESAKPDAPLETTHIVLDTNRQIALRVCCDSEITAENITLDFLVDADPTNIVAGQWAEQPKSPNGWNRWVSVARYSSGQNQPWNPETIIISQNLKRPFFEAIFSIHASRSKTWYYAVDFRLPNNNESFNKSVTNRVDKP